MKLRSSKVLERERLGVVLGLENIKSPVAKWISRGSGTSNSCIKEENSPERLSVRLCKSKSGKKRTNEAEIGVCIDNADEDVELGSINDSKTVISEGIKDGVNSDDKFLGSEVLDPIKDLPVSFGEIEEESVETVHVEEGNKSSTSDIINGDLSLLNDSKTGDNGTGEIKKKKGRGRPRKKKRKIMEVSGGDMAVDGGESGVVKSKRGRKRKNTEGSGCNEDEKAKKKKVKVRVSERVLQLKSVAAVSGGPMVVDCGPPKKKKEKKKVETRGRPRKIKTDEIPLKPIKKRSEKKKKHKDMIIKKLKTRKIKLTGIKNRKNRSKGKNVKKRSNLGEGEMGRGERMKVIRAKLLDMILKAGWMVDRRPRLDRAYQDKIYIEPNGRSHWSITKAYTMLTKKVKDGDADDNEVNAFIQIPNDEMNMLYRPIDKKLGYKKKKNRIWVDGKRIKKDTTTKKKKKEGQKGIKKVNPTKKIQKGKKGISGKSRKPRLLARGLETGTKKQEIKKRNLVSWMIDSGVISSGAKVKYAKTRKRVYEGKVTSDGIVCGCCNESMSVCEFVSHCGGKVNPGFDDVYLESGVSLRKCLMDSWRKEEELNGIRFNVVDMGDDPNDDTCNVCGDGGDLICCDGCPSTFHQSCLDIQNFPPGDWNCIYCSCKFCGVVSEIAPEKPPSEMLSCGLCEEKFHQSCVIEVGDVDMDSNKPPFCGQKCQELFERLQTYIGVKNVLEDGFSWTLLQRFDISQELTNNLKVENNSKLAVAFSVMDECFLPIVDGRSGTTIIRNVVYNCGSNFRRLNYAGFLTAVLEKGEELVTAASIRLHGSRLAEMPFIGTRHMYRRQGMCRRLLDAIESTLSSIGVEELIIPAIPALLQTWTKVFGFSHLKESKKQEIKSKNMLAFPGIDMLQKPLLQTNSSPSKDSDEKTVECTAGPMDENVSQTTPKDVIDCNEMPVDEFEITKNAIDDENQETTSSNAVVDYEEKPEVEKDVIDFEQTEEEEKEEEEEDITVMDNNSCPEDKLTNSNGPDSLSDLNFPVKEVTAGPMSTDFTIRPCSTESVTCGAHQLSEPELIIENDVVKVSPLTPNLVPKNVFDLNLHPTVVDSDMHIFGM